MTRVNCLHPKYLLDEHVKADVHEGLRPVGEVVCGKTNLKGCPDDWKLGKGHVLFLRNHLSFTITHWLECQERYKELGYSGYDFSVLMNNIPDSFLNDYTPTKKAMRSNLARIIVRWRARGIKYHYNKKPVSTRAEMLKYIEYVKKENNLFNGE